MKLYNYWRSSSSWRVRIALAYKNIPYDYVAVHLLKDGGEQHLGPHQERNPMEQVPTLETSIAGKTEYLSQSIAILEYLEETHPNPPLLPKNPWQRALVRSFVEVVNSGIQPYQGPALGTYLEQSHGGNRTKWNIHWNRVGLQALETIATKTSGVYSVGDEITLADCCLVPQMHAAKRFQVDLVPFPHLRRIEETCLRHAAFQHSHPDRQPDAEK